MKVKFGLILGTEAAEMLEDDARSQLYSLHWEKPELSELYLHH